MQGIRKDERGAALVTVLLFLTLTFILISSMMAISGNEIVLSGLHRDSVKALDLAQAGIQEAIVRISQGRPYAAGFTSSLNPGVTVTVIRRGFGSASAYDEIQSTAIVGRATRRVSALVRQQSIVMPPNITFANSINQSGNGQINSGDAYSRTFLVYKMNPTPGLTYAGWRISQTAPSAVAPCYTSAQCAASGRGNWYAGTRRSEYQTSATGADILAQRTNCPAGGGGPLPTTTITGILATDSTMTPQTVNVYGFDTDNNNAVTANLPCGLPYKYVAETFTDENGVSRTILFKTVVYEQWFKNYWQFDEGTMSYVKQTSLNNNPQYSAVPPFPDFSMLAGNYDQVLSGGGTISGGTLGTPSAPLNILLTGGTWQLNGTATGNGTLAVDGGLTINGTFTYTGTILVNGTFTQGAGTANITGGLVARSTLDLTGTFSVNGGGTTVSVPVGPSVVISKAWWER